MSKFHCNTNISFIDSMGSAWTAFKVGTKTTAEASIQTWTAVTHHVEILPMSVNLVGSSAKAGLLRVAREASGVKELTKDQMLDPEYMDQVMMERINPKEDKSE